MGKGPEGNTGRVGGGKGPQEMRDESRGGSNAGNTTAKAGVSSVVVETEGKMW